MKNLTFTFIALLLFLSVNNKQAQNSTTQPEKNFFQVRDEILKEFKKAKA